MHTYFQRFRDYVLDKHEALTGQRYMWGWSEYADETVAKTIEGSYHVSSCLQLFRDIRLGEYDDGAGAAKNDHTQGNYRMLPLLSVARPGRHRGAPVGNYFSNGVLTPDIGRYHDNSPDQRTRRAVGVWLGVEWAWGTVPAYFGIYNNPALLNDPLAGGDLWDEENYSSTHPLGAASPEIKTLRELWVSLTQAELSFATSYFHDGIAKPLAELQAGTTYVDLVAEGIWDVITFSFDKLSELLGFPPGTIQITGDLPTAHGFSGPFLYDENNFPQIVHSIWRNETTGRVCIFLVNVTRSTGTWKGLVDFGLCGMNAAKSVRAFQLSSTGKPGLIGDFNGATGQFDIEMGAWTMSAILLVEEDDYYEVTMSVEDFKAVGTLVEGEIQLSWKLPTAPSGSSDKFQYPEVKEVIVVRRQGQYPANVTDGTEVYRGTGTSYLDTGLQPDKVYYYAAFIDDGVTVTVT